MRALIVVEKISKDDEIFGFFHGRLLDFVEKHKDTTILCLEEREHNLPENIEVYSLGKEVKKSRFKYIYKFVSTILKTRYSYDVVFVHMAPQYVVLGAPFWRIMGKKVIFWYQHPNIDWWFKIASQMAHTSVLPVERPGVEESSKVKVIKNKSDLEVLESVL